MTAPLRQPIVTETRGFADNLAEAFEAAQTGGREAFLAARKRQRIEAQARSLGVDADALERGHLIHLDRRFARFDTYADDTADDRQRRREQHFSTNGARK